MEFTHIIIIIMALYPVVTAAGYTRSNRTYVEYITENGTLIDTSEYPFQFESARKYKWIIVFPDERYVRIGFINVSMYNTEGCFDRLNVSKDYDAIITQTIDHHFNGREFVVETDQVYVVLTLSLCQMSGKTNSGFKAIITQQDIPACFGIEGVPWSKGRKTSCELNTMVLTSMSLLNFPFLEVEEKWIILAGDHHRTDIYFTDFNVRCPFWKEDDDILLSATFILKDCPEEIQVCNNDLPPDYTIRCHSAEISIILRPPRRLYSSVIVNGFRLQYSAVDHSLANITESGTFADDFFSELPHYYLRDESRENFIDFACSKTFMRCYIVIRPMKETNWEDGNKFCKEYNLQLLSLQSKYELQYINYLLRRSVSNLQRYIRFYRFYSENDFAAHIGLRLYRNKKGEKKYLWENGSPVTFTAWRPENPFLGKDCTKTYFRRFEERTWESIHCTKEQASFFVCVTELTGTKYNKNGSRENTVLNSGLMRSNVTYSGNICQRWDKITEKAKQDFKSKFPDLKIPTEASNYCYDPYSSGVYGCYIENFENKWEPCLFQLTEPSLQKGYKQSGDNFLFSCRNGSKISSLNRCDGSFDCSDYSDENSCFDEEIDHKQNEWYTSSPFFLSDRMSPLYRQLDLRIKSVCNFAFCSSPDSEHHLIDFKKSNITSSLPDRLVKGSYHRCESMEWISILAKCDGVIDCVDASDELHCLRTREECDENELACDGGRCIHVSQVCDFISDCADSKDELCDIRPCEYGEFRCANLQCIDDNKVCNAIPDCVDGSDERVCDSCKQSFHCDGSKCISYRLVGDKFPDCEDGSDEKSYLLSSCDKWREIGYSNSGYYEIGGIPVFCDFTSTGKTIGEIKERYDDRKGYFRWTFKSACDTMERTDGINCNIKITRCPFSSKASRVYSEVGVKGYFSTSCQCEIWTYMEIRFLCHLKTRNLTSFLEESGYSGIYGSCDGNITGTKSFFELMDLLNQRKEEYRFETVPTEFICANEYKVNTTFEWMTCEEGNGPMPLSIQCVYDLDIYGNMIGCRSGSHLQNCSSFHCPNNTVKCPRSYCIPLRFICDGDIQCPTGDDEFNCTCQDTGTGRDVVIITEDTESEVDSRISAAKLAEQFYSPGSVIRLLLFSTTPGLTDIPIKHELLDVRETLVNPFQVNTPRTDYIRYKSMARNLLHILQFSKNDTKAVVFIEDSLKSSSVAYLLFSNLSRPTFSTYRVINDGGLNTHKKDRYRFVKDIHIVRWEALFAIGYRRFPELCQAVTVVPCSGRYRCASSKQCIPLEQICDGIPQCIGKDDEKFCDFLCPSNCTCAGYSVNCRGTNLNLRHAIALTRKTRSADVSSNPGIHEVLTRSNLHLPFLITLNVSSCRIRRLDRTGFDYLYNLVSLDIGYNKITVLPENAFSNLRFLHHLNLIGNFDIRVILPTAFHGLARIDSLQITGTKVKRISAYTFSNFEVKTIDISYNRIQVIEDFAFDNISVEKINFEGNKILTFNKLIFRGVTSLKELRTPAYKFCCIRPCSVKEIDCFPTKNEFSSCKDLMRHPILQAMLWIVGVVALTGNFGSIVYRLVYDRARLKIGYGIFVTNLAAADFLMGVYLIAIAVVDSLYRDIYIFKDEQWRNSKWCTIAGILSTVSSEASVLFLCLITIDRLLVIKYPFGTIKIGPKKAYIFCVVSWVIAIVLALVPIIFTGYFKNSFYSRSGVCIALPLTRDKPPGWMYSVAIFVGLNFCTFILVAFGQLSIFIELRKASSNIKKNTLRSRKQDLKVARNLILVATTDFLCWFPVGVMGIMALSGYPIPGDVYAWTAVFILPLNSALNPLLYTLSAIIGKQTFNPSTEEQNRTELQKQIGSSLLQYENVLSSMDIVRNVPIRNTMRSVQDVLTKDGSFPAITSAAIGLKLSKYLSILHDSSVAVDKISASNTYMRMYKKKKENVILALDWKLSLTEDKSKMQKNIYEFGLLLQQLTSNKK